MDFIKKAAGELQGNKNAGGAAGGAPAAGGAGASTGATGGAAAGGQQQDYGDKGMFFTITDTRGT